jgi:hypothetical protein
MGTHFSVNVTGLLVVAQTIAPQNDPTWWLAMSWSRGGSLASQTLVQKGQGIFATVQEAHLASFIHDGQVGRPYSGDDIIFHPDQVAYF